MLRGATYRSIGERITGVGAGAVLAAALVVPSVVRSPVERRRGKQTRGLGEGTRLVTSPRGIPPHRVGVAPGPLHSPSSPRVSPPQRGHLPRIRTGLFFAVAKVAPASPSSDRRNLTIAANGDARPGCLAFELRQSGLPNFVNDARDEHAHRLPTDRRVVSFINLVHSRNVRNGARQCLSHRISVQVEPKIGRGRPASGERLAARDLDVDRQYIRRAKQIASLAPEAKAAARDVGLDDNQSALLTAAKAPAQQQAAIIRQYADEKRIKEAQRADKGARLSAAEELALMIQELPDPERFIALLATVTPADVARAYQRLAA